MNAEEKDPQAYQVIGAAMEVHRCLGHGFLEAVYQEALALELGERSVPFEREPRPAVRYKGTALSCCYKPDFICYGDVLVELKALGQLTNNEYAQIINYLKAAPLARGLLVNLGAPRLEYKRFVFSHNLRTSAASVN